MRVLVCGGREYSDWGQMRWVLGAIRIDTVITGAARGADSVAGEWATDQGVDLVTYPANWERDGKSAGFKRNQLMLDNAKPDLVVAFPGGNGTAHMVRIAKEAGVPVLRVE